MSAIGSAFNYIQQESVSFNNPVSEASLTAMGASINGLLSVLLPVGSVIHTMLTESQFQTQLGNSNWILADGRSVAGSGYNNVTGNTNVPDLRGAFLRSKDNGKGLNPDGDLALGATQAQSYASHNHGVTDPGHPHTFGIGSHGSDNQTHTMPYGSTNDQSGAWSTSTDQTGISIQSSGGNETRPVNVTVNLMIRIN